MFVFVVNLHPRIFLPVLSRENERKAGRELEEEEREGGREKNIDVREIHQLVASSHTHLDWDQGSNSQPFCLQADLTTEPHRPE